MYRKIGGNPGGRLEVTSAPSGRLAKMPTTGSVPSLLISVCWWLGFVEDEPPQSCNCAFARSTRPATCIELLAAGFRLNSTVVLLSKARPRVLNVPPIPSPDASVLDRKPVAVTLPREPRPLK